MPNNPSAPAVPRRNARRVLCPPSCFTSSRFTFRPPIIPPCQNKKQSRQHHIPIRFRHIPDELVHNRPLNCCHRRSESPLQYLKVSKTDPPIPVEITLL